MIYVQFYIILILVIFLVAYKTFLLLKYYNVNNYKLNKYFWILYTYLKDDN